MRGYRRPPQFTQHNARSLRIFQRRPEKLANYENNLVRIWSEEHFAWWRIGTGADGRYAGGGYTDQKASAGMLPLRDAFALTRHCGPEKEIWFAFVPAREIAAARPENETSLREVIARGVYDRKPFRIARSGGVMEMMQPEQELSWEDAPGWYRDECFDIADGVHARMLLAQAEGERTGS
jgi:hypothetical protein